MTGRRQIVRRIATGIAALVVGSLTLAACTAQTPEPGPILEPDPHVETEQPLKVVTSFTILEDMVHALGGDRVEVHNLVPTGTDPHEYEPLPDDIRAAADADLLLFNGLNLEGGRDGWFTRLARAAGQPAERIIEVSRGVPPLYLGDGGSDDLINPHAFIDPAMGELMAGVIREALMRADPENAEVYRERGAAYFAELAKIRAAYDAELGAIPAERRILVTSERAFQYLAATYGLQEYFIWQIDTEENGSAKQIIALVEALRDLPVRYLVMESNKDPRPMQMVAEELDIEIFELPIYSDEIGAEGADTYLLYLEHNLEVLTGALG